MTITIEDVKQAATQIKGAVQNSPFLPSKTLSAITGADIYIKFENLQFTGAFKERGALNKLLSLTEAEKAAGVIAVSAGNHAQAVAYHAQRLDIKATIVMPKGTPFIKVRQTSHFGPRVILEGETFNDAAAFAADLAKEENLTVVHPYDDAHVMAGQGTMALEMLAQEPDLDALVIPVGGGGMISGCVVAAKGSNPDIEVYAAESQAYPGLTNALGEEDFPVGGQTVAEGIAVKQVGGLPLETLRDNLAGVLMVTESQIEEAISLLIEIEKTVAEGAGATGLAAILAFPEHFKGKKVGMVLSGGNIDSRLLASILTRGLVRQGRIARLRVEIPDQPGMLAKIATIVGEAEANIIEVSHQRLFSDISVKSADLDLMLETRDEDHVDLVMAALAKAGVRARKMTIDSRG